MIKNHCFFYIIEYRREFINLNIYTMKKIKFATIMLALIVWGGVQTMYAQVTNISGEDKTTNQEMVSDAWERDWDNMNEKNRQSFSDEWTYTSETDRLEKAQQRQQRRQQELNEMTSQERDVYTQNLEIRRNEWQSMNANEREQFGQRVLDYYSGDSVHQYYSRH